MTNERFKNVLNNYLGWDYPLLKWVLTIVFNISLFFIPLYFAYSRFSEFSFTFLNCLKFFGWFSLSYIILIVLANVILGFLANES